MAPIQGKRVHFGCEPNVSLDAGNNYGGNVLKLLVMKMRSSKSMPVARKILTMPSRQLGQRSKALGHISLEQREVK
jgi:hypothetical protein